MGGGKSGKVVNQTGCTHDVKNPLSPNGNNVFGWGSNSYTFSFAKTGNVYDVMIVGASALSHIALGCATQGCINQPWIGAYALSL